MPLTSILLKGCQSGFFTISSQDEHNFADISCHCSLEYFCKQKSWKGFGSNSPILLIPSWERPPSISRKLYKEKQSEVMPFYTLHMLSYYEDKFPKENSLSQINPNVLSVWQNKEGRNLTFIDSFRASSSSWLYWRSLTIRELQRFSTSSKCSNLSLNWFLKSVIWVFQLPSLSTWLWNCKSLFNCHNWNWEIKKKIIQRYNNLNRS